MMIMIYVFCMAGIIAGGYFALRYFSIKRALRDADLELQEIRKDLTQNQILHLSAPDKDLEQFIHSINHALEDMKKERQSCQKREKVFQQQMENISHDLRTPLTVILGYLKYIRSKESQPKHLEETLETIERKARAMEKLVSQFYDISRLASQDYELSIQRLDVCRLLREALTDNYQTLAQKDLKIETHLPNHPVFTHGDTQALERIFSNLLQNAGRYALTFFRAELLEYPGKACIRFTNDSSKLAPQDIPHLFERFYMQDAARSQSGTGLGLTIAKSLAEAMGGALTAELAEPVPGAMDGALTAESAEPVPGAMGDALTAESAEPVPGALSAKAAESGRLILRFTLTLV